MSIYCRFASLGSFCTTSAVVINDGLDNDCDSRIDEELVNGIDDDGDGQVDEDTVGAGLTSFLQFTSSVTA